MSDKLNLNKSDGSETETPAETKNATATQVLSMSQNQSETKEDEEPKAHRSDLTNNVQDQVEKPTGEVETVKGAQLEKGDIVQLGLNKFMVMEVPAKKVDGYLRNVITGQFASCNIHTTYQVAK